MLKRFLKYYRPHIPLFVLDMSTAVASSAVSVFFPYLTRDLLRVYLPEGNVRMVVILLAIMCGIYLFNAVMTYIRMRWGHFLGVRMEYDMRAELFRHLQKLSFTYFDNTKTGHIMSRISNDLNMITEVAHHAPEDFLTSFLLLVGAFIFMFMLNATLALLALIPLPFMFVWGWSYGRKMKESFRVVRRKIADINSTVENSVQGIREVKSYTNEGLEIDRFGRVNDTFKNAKERMYTVMARFFSGMNLLRNLYYVTVIAGGAWLIGANRLDVVDLLVFILYVGIILPPIDRLINFTEQFQQGAASFERFIEIMDTEPEIQDKHGARSLDDVAGRIEIDGVSFMYSSSSDWVLRDVNITVEAGERIAIVGESGAGKSTVVSLIPRFYEPQKGAIRIDGHSIMDLRQRFLRRNIGLVQQNVFLFDDTIRENITYGKPDATAEELLEAAKMANIDEFILSLPDGFDTLVGERGVKLSGGQKQRVSIARVFLKDPPILIFDEATSSLDSESEGVIQEAMFKLSENRTAIIIAHRLSTVRNVDRIHVMRDGRVVEIGSHDELIDLKGYYEKLYALNLL